MLEEYLNRLEVVVSIGAESGTNTEPSLFYSNIEMTSFEKGSGLARGEEIFYVFLQRFRDT